MFFFPFALFQGSFIINILAAVLPALYLMRLIHRMDRIEQEPRNLLWKLFGLGVLAAISSIFLETVLGGLLDGTGIKNTSVLYAVLLAFVVVAAVEEGTKYFFMKVATWRNPNFNYRFDGIVYSVAVSLGFAGLENVGYIFRYGLLIAGQRAVLAVPAHVGFAVFMGIFYSRSKMYHNRGRRITGRLNGFFAWFFPAMLHGFYDTTAMLQSTTSTIVYISFVIVMYITVFTLVRNEGKRDMHL